MDDRYIPFVGLVTVLDAVLRVIVPSSRVERAPLLLVVCLCSYVSVSGVSLVSCALIGL